MYLVWTVRHSPPEVVFHNRLSLSVESRSGPTRSTGKSDGLVNAPSKDSGGNLTEMLRACPGASDESVCFKLVQSCAELTEGIVGLVGQI